MIYVILSRNKSDLDAVIRQFADTESFGTEYKKDRMTSKDQVAIDIVAGGTRQLEVGYEVVLPWKPASPSLPVNRQLVVFRVNSLCKKFEKDPVYKGDYEKAIKKYFKMGYATKVPVVDLNNSIQYFLPHNGIYKKGSRKLRIVFDSAAVY
jgi:hypothetical protein